MADKARHVGSSALAVLVVGLPAASQSLWPPSALATLPMYRNYAAHREGSWDRTLGNGDLRSIGTGQTLELMRTQGAGMVTHFWCTIAAEKMPLFPRWLVLRAYWDGERQPSIEAPIGDFFCSGHGRQDDIVSVPVACYHGGTGRNCYFPMPFGASARITLTNEHPTESVRSFYWNIDYLLYDKGKLPEDLPRFHAKYRQEFPTAEGQDYLILEAEGRGHFVGCNVSIQKAVKGGWFGEGDEVICVDGEDRPHIWGTGTEDYFGTAWSPHVYSGLYSGFTCMEGWEKPGQVMTGYRFHIPDAIPFRKSIRVSIEHAGDRSKSFSDYYSSVAYWYQSEPHKEFFKLPSGAERLPRTLEQIVPPLPAKATIELNALPAEAIGEATAGVQEMATFGTGWSDGAQVMVLANAPGQGVRFVFRLAEAVAGELELWYTQASDYGDFEVLVDGKKKGEVLRGFAEGVRPARASLGPLALAAGEHVLEFRVTGKSEKNTRIYNDKPCYFLGLDAVRVVGAP